MFNKSFLAFNLLHVTVPAICVTFFAANPLWIIGNLVFAAATIRSIHTKSSAYVIILLCLVSGVTFALTLMLGASYYMQGEGFNDSFFYQLNTGTLIIAARSYGSVFYPALLCLLPAFLAPAIIRNTMTHKLLPAIPALLLWILALASSYPIYSLANYQISLAVESEPYRDSSHFPEITKKETTPVIAKPQTDNATPVIPKNIITKAVVGQNYPTDGGKSDAIIAAALSAAKETSMIPVKTEIEAKTAIKKNIIFIYAESLEQLYFDKEIFGELLPNIRKLSTRAHRFTNLRQVRGTGWTIAGMVASQCGFPLKVSNHLASNSTMASVDRPYPDEICLADILSAQGYETVYMGGAPLWFGGKGNFLETHGYRRIFGDEELAPMLPDKQYQSGWGLYDDSLFKLALKELKSLETGEHPYLLTLLTLDTHHPNGIRSKSCKKLVDNRDPMSNAIFCSDQLISQFITESMNIVDMNETIIVLFSDHLSLRNTLWSKLKANQHSRKLTLMIFDHAPGTESNLPATHFDVAPTLLEAAGLTDQFRIGAGFSLYSQKTNKSANRPLAQDLKITPALLNQSSSAKQSGVDISRSNLSISIGALTLKANAAGQKFVSGMYLAVFNEEGNAIDAIYSDDYANLVKNLSGVFVVGISILPDRPDFVTYFYGRISKDGKGIIQRPLNKDTHLSNVEILTNM